MPHPTQPESAFSVPFEAASAALARERVGRMLAGVGIDGRSREDVMVVVSELVGNAVRHARPLPAGGLRVRVRVDAGRVSVAVDDGGAISLPTLRVARRHRAPVAAASRSSTASAPAGAANAAPTAPRRCGRSCTTSLPVHGQAFRTQPHGIPPAPAPRPPRRTTSRSSAPANPVRAAPDGATRPAMAARPRHADTLLVDRPFRGLPSEPDWVALREIVPAATAPLALLG